MLISVLDVSHGQILSNRASVRLESQGELTRVFLNLCKIIFVLFIILNYLFLYMSNELDYKFLHFFCRPTKFFYFELMISTKIQFILLQ